MGMKISQGFHQEPEFFTEGGRMIFSEGDGSLSPTWEGNRRFKDEGFWKKSPFPAQE
jgi:hypothetical protein